MSLLPALMAMIAVMLAAAGATALVRDGGIAAAQHVDRQLARQRAENALHLEAARFEEAGAAAGSAAGGDAAVTIEDVPSSAIGEIADLPLQIRRVTVTGEAGRSLVRLQADYAVDGCESAHDDPCIQRVRRIAWRELAVE